jgi:hypothetical protein
MRVAICLWLAMAVGSCITINELPPPIDTAADSGPKRDSGSGDAGERDAAGDGGGSCTPTAETCNGLDDDCDGVTDDDDPEAQAHCEGVIHNAATYCSEVMMKWVCVPAGCDDGFANCDGEPSNGCEPECCNDCPDSGSEDGGADDAGAQ